MKYHRGEKKKKASHTRQLRKRTKMKPMETGSMFSFQNKGWRNKLWTEGGYWEMNFSVTQVTRKKEPQQQLRFKMTTHEKTWKNTVLGINRKQKHLTAKKNKQTNNKKRNQPNKQKEITSIVCIIRTWLPHILNFIDFLTTSTWLQSMLPL